MIRGRERERERERESSVWMGRWLRKGGGTWFHVQTSFAGPHIEAVMFF